MTAPASQSPSSAAARDVARRIFTREIPAGADDATLVAAAEGISTRVSGGLSRWFGSYGSRALVTRALARAQADHHALAAVRVGTEQSPHLTGLAESARTHGGKATTDGVVAVLAVLADLIGRLIGDDLAFNLLEQSSTVPHGDGRSPAAAPTQRVAAPRAEKLSERRETPVILSPKRKKEK